MWQLLFLAVIFLTFWMFGLCTLMHTVFFYYKKATLMRHEHRNNAPTAIAVGRHHKRALNNWGKQRKGVRDWKRSDKTVR